MLAAPFYKEFQDRTSTSVGRKRAAGLASPEQYPKDFTGFRGERLTILALELCGQDRCTETHMVVQALALQESGQITSLRPRTPGGKRTRRLITQRC